MFFGGNKALPAKTYANHFLQSSKCVDLVVEHAHEIFMAAFACDGVLGAIKLVEINLQ